MNEDELTASLAGAFLFGTAFGVAVGALLVGLAWWLV